MCYSPNTLSVSYCFLCFVLLNLDLESHRYARLKNTDMYALYVALLLSFKAIMHLHFNVICCYSAALSWDMCYEYFEIFK